METKRAFAIFRPELKSCAGQAGARLNWRKGLVEALQSAELRLRGRPTGPSLTS
jgi:hypothetical protein